MVCWFPEDDADFCSPFSFEPPVPFETPPKPSSYGSAPGTPSQTTGDWGRELVHSPGEANGGNTFEPHSSERKLHATPILDSRDNGAELLLLCTHCWLGYLVYA